MKIKLRKGVMFNGSEIKELDLDLETLTPQDIIDAENEVMRSSNIPVVLDFNRDFCITIAAKCLHMPADSLKMMNVKDFNKIITEVRNFLADTDSEQEKEKDA